MGKPAEPRLRFSTLKNGADLLGMSAQGFQELTRKDGFPEKGEDGMWRAGEIVAWYLQQKTDSPEYEKERARKMRADATKAELDVAQREGRLVSVSEVEREWSGQVTKLRETVGKGFHTLAPKLSGLDAAGILVELQSWWKKAQRAIAK